MSYMIIFEVASLLQYLIDNVSPKDIKLTTGSVRLLISPRDAETAQTRVGFTSGAVQIHDLAKGVGISEEKIDELRSHPDKWHSKWEIISKLGYRLLMLLGFGIIAIHVVHLAS